jgi:hypothetical protein
MYLCGGAGGETQTSRKCCSEDKAADFEARDDFHDESSLFFFDERIGLPSCQNTIILV